MPDRRRALLTAALGFLQLAQRAPELRILHAWLDSWDGVGLIIGGMVRHGYKLSLRNVGVDDGWLATFHGDPLTSAAGFATAPTPWNAVQAAAWTVVKRVVT